MATRALYPLMEQLVDPSAFKQLFLDGTRYIDVRAPIEFSRGHLPGAINEPLLNDSERAAVGLEFRLRGEASAIALGHQLVTGDVKRERVSRWEKHCTEGTVRALHCARGGLRSQIACKWLAECGIDLPRIVGGYKALRHFLTRSFSAALTANELLVLSGQTGSGKTRFLRAHAGSIPTIDLEALANHCGSSFGGIYGPQPAQATFENYLFAATLQAAERAAARSPLLLEDESRRIGAVHLPNELLAKMPSARRLVLERPIEERIEIIKEDYVLTPLARQTDRNAAFLALREALTGAVLRLSRRLGDQRTRATIALLESALTAHEESEDSSQHNQWIELLLREYYDPSYNRQLAQCRQTIVARGTAGELEKFIASAEWN